MAHLRRSARSESPIWPGFVDAMTSLLMVLMFVLTVFILVQSVLRDTITTQDSELDSLAAQVADRVIVLCAGQIIADGLTEEVLSNKELVEAGGLTPSALLPVCEQAGLPPCITVEGVKRYVRKTAMGRH